MSTILLTFASFAASISLQVPTLSTACASAVILRGLPGTNPTAIMRESMSEREVAREEGEDFTRSSWRRVTEEASIWEGGGRREGGREV